LKIGTLFDFRAKIPMKPRLFKKIVTQDKTQHYLWQPRYHQLRYILNNTVMYQNKTKLTY